MGLLDGSTDTLSAGIGVTPLVVPDEQSAVHRPAVERFHPSRGWPTSDRNGRDQIGISGTLLRRSVAWLPDRGRVGAGLPPEVWDPPCRSKPMPTAAIASRGS